MWRKAARARPTPQEIRRSRIARRVSRCSRRAHGVISLVFADEDIASCVFAPVDDVEVVAFRIFLLSLCRCTAALRRSGLARVVLPARSSRSSRCRFASGLHVAFVLTTAMPPSTPPHPKAVLRFTQVLFPLYRATGSSISPPPRGRAVERVKVALARFACRVNSARRIDKSRR